MIRHPGSGAALSIALSFLAAAAAGQTPHAGRYHADPRLCGDRDTVVVAPGRILTPAYGECRLSDPSAIRGLSARLYDMTCNDEGGRTYSERVLLHFDPEGALLMLVESGYRTYPRCR
jgi:hypothetical protein